SISTSSTRGSTLSERGLPFTITLIATFSIVSGIDVAYLDLLAARPAACDLDRASDQCSHQRSLVFGRSAHIGLGVGSRAGAFCRCRDSLVSQRLAVQKRFSSLCLDGSQSHTAQNNRALLADIAIHRELNSGTGCGIDRR